MPLDFKQAKQFVMPFGQHRGETLDAIATDDEGLKYLDWLVGRNWVDGALKEALTAYLSDKSIKKELNALLGRS